MSKKQKVDTVFTIQLNLQDILEDDRYQDMCDRLQHKFEYMAHEKAMKQGLCTLEDFATGYPFSILTEVSVTVEFKA